MPCSDVRANRGIRGKKQPCKGPGVGTGGSNKASDGTGAEEDRGGEVRSRQILGGLWGLF